MTQLYHTRGVYSCYNGVYTVSTPVTGSRGLHVLWRYTGAGGNVGRDPVHHSERYQAAQTCGNRNISNGPLWTPVYGTGILLKHNIINISKLRFFGTLCIGNARGDELGEPEFDTSPIKEYSYVPN